MNIPASPPEPAPVRLSVAVETPQHAGLGGVLDYLSPTPWPAGTLLRVPLGRRTVPGVVWGPAPETAGEAEGQGPAPTLREVAEAFDALPPLPPAWRALVDFAAQYYQRGTGELALGVLPPELRKLAAAQFGRRLARRCARRPRPPRRLAGPRPCPARCPH